MNEEWVQPSAKYPHYFKLCKILHEVFVDSGRSYALFGWAKFSDKAGSGNYEPKERHVVGFKPMDSDVYPPLSLAPVPVQEKELTAAQCHGPSQLHLGMSDRTVSQPSSQGQGL